MISCHDVVFAGFLVVGITATLFPGAAGVVVILLVIIQLVGIIHLGPVFVVILILEQTAFGSIPADPFHLGVFLGGGVFLGIIGSGGILGIGVLLRGRRSLPVNGSLGSRCCSSGAAGLALRRHIVGHRIDLLLLTFRRTAGILQDCGQRSLDTRTVPATFRTNRAVFLIGMESTAGTEPAVLGILRHAGQLAVASALLQRPGDGSRQYPGRLQTHTLVAAQVHTAAIEECTVLFHFHAGHRRVTDIHRIVTAEHVPRLGIELFVVEIILAENLARGVLTFEVYHQTCQRFGAHIFEGQADRDFTGHVPFEQLDPHELHRTAGCVIVGA